MASRSREAAVILYPDMNRSGLLTVDGRLEEARDLADSLAERAEELGARGFGMINRSQYKFEPLMLLGRFEEYLDQQRVYSIPRAQESRLALVHARVGHEAEAKGLLEKLMSKDLQEMRTPELTTMLETAVLVKDQESASLLADHLSPAADTVGYFPGRQSNIARHLGAAAALLGELDKARAYYQQALEVCAKVRFRPEIALTRLQLAELIFKHYLDERPQALEHLDFAIAEFREMKMQPSLERALKHKELLGA